MLRGTATRISSPVTPRVVAPPLDPSKYGTHGGDCGSSVWRGGSPKQRRRRARSTVGWPGTVVVGPAGVVVVVVVGPPLAPDCSAPPGPWPFALACSDGAFWICWLACGANSAIAGGGV